MAQFSTTYAGLVSTLTLFTVDDSNEFSQSVQGIIGRAEERCLRDLDVSLFNVSAQTTTGTVMTVSKTNPESPIRTIYLTSQGTFLKRRTRSYVEAHGGTGVPVYFYDDQTLIYFAPTPDQAYSITINQLVRPRPLTSSNTTNWLSTHVADLLLWACLVEAEAFLIAPERIAEFNTSYAACLGPIRAFWRELAQNGYDVEKPTPQPVQDR